MLKEADKFYADTVIHCKDGDIKCHKNIICKRSEFFNNMMAANMKEGRSGEIRLPEMMRDVCYTILEYIYTNHIEDTKIDLAVLIEADKMGLSRLQDECNKHFIEARSLFFQFFYIIVF